MAKTGFRRVAASRSTSESAQPTSAITGMVYRLVPVGGPVVAAVAGAEAEAAAVVLEAVGVVMAVMVLTMKSCWLKGRATRGQGTSK